MKKFLFAAAMASCLILSAQTKKKQLRFHCKSGKGIVLSDSALNSFDGFRAEVENDIITSDSAIVYNKPTILIIDAYKNVVVTSGAKTLYGDHIRFEYAK